MRSGNPNPNNTKKAGNPRWKKGVSGNPKGRPKGSGSERTKLIGAILRMEEEHSFNWWEETVMQSRTEPSIRIAIMKKLVPDLKSVDINTLMEGKFDINVNITK